LDNTLEYLGANKNMLTINLGEHYAELCNYIPNKIKENQKEN